MASFPVRFHGCENNLRIGILRLPMTLSDGRSSSESYLEILFLSSRKDIASRQQISVS